MPIGCSAAAIARPLLRCRPADLSRDLGLVLNEKFLYTVYPCSPSVCDRSALRRRTFYVERFVVRPLHVLDSRARLNWMAQTPNALAPPDADWNQTDLRRCGSLRNW